MKAIAVQAVFLIGVIAIFLFFMAAIFWGWIGVTKDTTSKASCDAHKISYCSGLIAGKTPDWNSGCGTKPSIDECCKGAIKGTRCPA